MTVQIIGTKKCNETKKALRFCKERGIDAQFRDINETPLSDGELKNIFRQIPAERLIDTASIIFVKGNYSWKEYDAAEEIASDNRLMKTPVVRIGKKIFPGFDPADFTDI